MPRYQAVKHEEVEQAHVPTCVDCGQEADVVIREHGYCAEHYCKRAANMRRNADGLILDGGVYRLPTEEERRNRDMAKSAYAARKNRQQIEKVKKISSGLRGVNNYLPD